MMTSNGHHATTMARVQSLIFRYTFRTHKVPNAMGRRSGIPVLPRRRVNKRVCGHPTCVVRCWNQTTPSCLHLKNGECKCGCACVNRPCEPWNHTKCRLGGPYPQCYYEKGKCDCYCSPPNMPCDPWNRTRCKRGRFPKCNFANGECNCYC
ncbi:uncharacterized protein LOC125760352 isoform X1 [Rhipicephalus sanguineus]|uniref:uncharacterized protein LOC125760352 isoform X1 n=1 Tax=Rhipicephalus sanguineus TaxID=34632 RepID=UPI0020C37137|nr:uncharacterized protein LOC125760352 isoform X1 [Rhipicephalus sanguineus]